MKAFWIILSIGFLSNSVLFGQGNEGYISRLKPELREVDTYQLVTDAGSIALYMEYAQSRILNPGAWDAVPENARFFTVDLVFTRYPESLEDWEIGFDSLLSDRFRQLEKIAPDLWSQTDIRWRLILQTGCRSMKQARELFHGFVISFSAPPEASLVENFSLITKFLNQEKDIVDTSTVTILKRHPEWKGMTIVADWTASMYANGSLMLLWLKDKLDSNLVEQLVFFNDGDSLPDSLKVIGTTGGIYQPERMIWEDILTAVEKVTLGGSGGDYQENDLEAVLKALELTPDPGELVLVADNKSGVRDLSLLPEVKVPLRILICGSSNGYLHPHYLTIAAYTGGSVHTLYEDITGLNELGEGETLTIGKFVYKREGEIFRRLGREDQLDYIWEK